MPRPDGRLMCHCLSRRREFMGPSRLAKLVATSTVAGVMALLGPAAHVGPAALAQTKPKVSFVYVGPIGDHGWSYQHHQGLQAIKAEFGDKIDTNYVENVPEGPDAER